ncbi:hypothetical protein H2200_002323 [Cladophialophora chaetospira]|uniref:AB hydrolase-1 domain-containing protein n=1 Tax=Cladophialophora chaetospira TaxID=386627 RepID=A0AA38XIQ0_9EURO|nr:hypothetical protein H2200_002323 [Cladophialophora chaetospira]
MAKPTFIIVHGAWHQPIHFQLVTKSLESYGYKVLAPALPSVDKAPNETTPDSQADIAAVRTTILDELDSAGNDVILVPHSYGGIPASGAVEGLNPESRAAEGKTTSVIGIAAITSYILPKGMNIPMAEFKPEPSMPALWGPPPTSMFWHDVPADSDLHAWAAKELNIMSMRALYDKCQFTAYRDMPVHYLLASEDRAVTLPTQESIVERIRKEGGEVRTEMLEGSSHSPFLSRVEETVGFLRRSAGEQV